ncbi:unnamed protein product, partial [marine sediment metagenome]
WDVNVLDIGDPTVSCPEAITLRIDQKRHAIVVPYEATAVDHADSNPVITYSIEPNSLFEEGIYQIDVLATDRAGNSDACSIDIEILRPYPNATFEAVLIKADVHEISEDVFGASLQVLTFTNVYHKVDLSVASPSADNQNAQIEAGNVYESSANCAADAAVCQQEWSFDVAFDECTAEDKLYQFNADINCLPTDCLESSRHPISIELDASNYCWQDLEGVAITADMITVTQSHHDVYQVMYASDPETGLPEQTTAFENGDNISGIISVSSPSVITTDV